MVEAAGVGSKGMLQTNKLLIINDHHNAEDVEVGISLHVYCMQRNGPIAKRE